MSKSIHNSNKNHRNKVIVLILLFTLLVVTLNGCSEYQTFTIKRGIAHFSFEYPARYGGKQVEVRNDPESKYTNIGLSWSPPNLLWRASDISVFMQPTTSANAEVELEERLTLESKMSDFKPLERYPVTISGLQGYGATFSWISPPMGLGHGPPGGEPRPIISRLVYFDYDGLIWNIYIGYDEATKDLGEAAYEHVIKTFKILE